MALLGNSKVALDQTSVTTKLHIEIFNRMAADDVIAFMAQSEAQRRFTMARQGIVRDPQTPSDDLKTYLMGLVEENG